MPHIKDYETLYEFEGPLVFVAELHGRARFFVAFDEKDDGRSFIAASVDSETVSAVREGSLSVLGALKAGDELHTVDIAYSMEAGALSPATLEGMTGKLPQPGVGISHRFGECPDEFDRSGRAFAG